MLDYWYMKYSTPQSASKINAMQEAEAEARRNSSKVYKVIRKVEA